MAEIHAATWNEIAQNGGQCIVIKLDDSDVPPLLGPKVYGKLDRHDPPASRALLEKICKSAVPEPNTLVLDVLRPASRNPFRYLRAEFFEDRPDLLAKAFAPPDALTAGALEEMKPCRLEGSRGTGKSMLLLSLRARNFLIRRRGGETALFGFYLKLSHGAVCNVGVVSKNNGDPILKLDEKAAQISDIAEQELIIQLLESLFSEIAFCISERRFVCTKEDERRLAREADKLLFDESVDSHSSSLDELLEKLGDAHKRIAAFIRRKFIYCESPPVPFVTFDREQLNRVIKLVRKQIHALSTTMFVALLDEYENLFPYQQKIVNTLVKLGPPNLSVKIAKKLGSSHTSATTTGQWLEETHDYTRLPLVYDVEDQTQRRAYRDLLSHMVKNIFKSAGLGDVDVDSLLPEATGDEVPNERVKNEVLKLCHLTTEEFDKLPDSLKREKWTYFRETAVYRSLYSTQGRREPKRFAGFKELAFLSSGVIRYFQEFLGVAYHLTFGSGKAKEAGWILPPESQTRAVHFVSQHNLTTISRNVEEYGEILKYFLLDLGDCLRHKLLKHGSEPEAARLTIIDPEQLQEPKMALLKQVLAAGVEEGVFQTKEGMPGYKPKHSSDPQPTEFNICRVFAPVLGISPRLRMRTSVDCVSLSTLLGMEGRAAGIRKLKAKLVKQRVSPNADSQSEFELVRHNPHEG